LRPVSAKYLLELPQQRRPLQLKTDADQLP